MADNFTFKRVEKKYLLSEDKYNRLLERLEPYIQLDEYGLHTICNIYYDTPDYDLIRTSIDKPVYKEKLRLRSYGIPDLDSKVFLEIKKKYDGIIHTKPFGCTPEITAIPIIQNVCKDYDMPILFFSFDEEQEDGGVNTRLEAFYDVLRYRKEKKWKKDI